MHCASLMQPCRKPWWCGRPMATCVVRSLLVVTAAVLNGCGAGTITINPPAPNSLVAPSFPVEVRWNGDIKGLDSVRIDGMHVMPQFVFDYGNKVARATLTAANGAHRIDASYQIPPTLFGLYGGSRKDGSVAFNVGSAPPPAGTVTLSLSPTTRAIERGASGTVAVTVTRGGGFAGAVTVSLSGLPADVTANTLTVPSGQTTGTLTLSVGASATFQQMIATVTGAGPAGSPASAGNQLTLVIPRALGAFSEASPTPYASTVPSSVASLSGTFSASITTGAQAGLPQARAAQFRRGSNAIGSAIGFTLGLPIANLGGAGFCRDNSTTQPALTRGVVLSNAPGGSNAQYSFTFIDLTGTPTVLRQIVADGSRTSPAVTAQPRVFFSPDCTLALVTGVYVLGPSSFAVNVLDLQTGNPPSGSCGWPIQYNSANSATALVRITGTTTQVVVTVDPGTATAQTCTFSVP